MKIPVTALVLLFLAVSSTAHAMRRVWPMGHFIREAELIVIADGKEGEGVFETRFAIREVLKGDKKFVGQTIGFVRTRFSLDDARVPADAEGVVLLRPGWQETKDWPILQTYLKADEIAAARVLVPICGIDDERSRLVALREAGLNRDVTCRDELFAQLKAMRAPENFDLLIDLNSVLGPTDQARLVELIGQIGDARGLPVLIAAAASPDEKVSRTAVDQLTGVFAGSPGVVEAMRHALGRTSLRQIAAQYLARYSSDPELVAIGRGKETPWRRAERLLESGKKIEARAAYLKIVLNEKESFWTRLNATSLLTPDATAVEKEQIRKTLLPLLARESFSDNYLQATDVAKILRSLHHPDCLPALLSIIRQTSSSHIKAACTATMAIRELGAEERRRAVTEISALLKSPPPNLLTGANPFRYPLELIWLGREKEFEQAESTLHMDHARSWKSLHSLRAIVATSDEVDFLVQQLPHLSASPAEATEWVMHRLGELKDPRAISELRKILVDQPDWTLTAGAADALVDIGGREVETELIKLLAHPDENRVRRHATEAIFKLLGNKSRELAWRIIAEKDFGWKPDAYLALAQVGTREDLKLLLAFSDYWTGDRANHYWAMIASQSVRQRCQDDANGPTRTTR